MLNPGLGGSVQAELVIWDHCMHVVLQLYDCVRSAGGECGSRDRGLSAGVQLL